jgi:hypothetical protein
MIWFVFEAMSVNDDAIVGVQCVVPEEEANKTNDNIRGG